MLTPNPQKEATSGEEPATVARRLSRRWKLLQVLGVALIALASLIDWPHYSDPTVPATPLFLLTLGVIVFIVGFVMQRSGTAGHTA
jgi:peptidoglycan/LPS O-acetylase OafA/YrhL